MRKLFSTIVGVICSLLFVNTLQAGVLDGGSSVVLLQGFHWESHLSTTWWDVINTQAADIAASGFDGVWLPPSSAAASDEGYLPTQLSVLDSKYGTTAKLQTAIASLHANNVKVIADIVINHRCGTTGWGDFTNPTWGTDSVCRDDEWGSGTGNYDTGEQYAAARDIDHTQEYVRTSIISWMNWLKSTIGYDGWRYDFVRGFAGSYVGVYNTATSPWISIGENWPSFDVNNPNSSRQTLCDWVNATGSLSGAFDFTTKGLLGSAVNGNYGCLRDSNGAPAGLIGWWAAKAVTFIDNHDTGPSTGGAGGQNLWAFPSDKVMQGYCYILTHPGIPMVYWVHMYDWGLHDAIKTLIQIRKAQGITSTSTISIQAADSTKYAAIIDNKVAMKIGSGSWAPSDTGWVLAASGNNYAVWTKTTTTTTNTLGDGIRTVIYMYKETVTGQDIFIKGGHDAGLVPSVYSAMSEPITYVNTLNTTTAAIKANDASLDWGTESALDWTCNAWPTTWGTQKNYSTDGYGYDPENTMGLHWWKFDVMMYGNVGDWFEFKAFMRQSATEWWESDIAQAGTPYSTINHWGKKGYITKCKYNDPWVEYVALGISGNKSPTASVTATPTTALVGATITFDASASTDPEDGSAVSVRWDWENDGTYDTAYSTTKTATHSWTTAGTKSVKVEVKDSSGATDSRVVTVTITTANTAPTAAITASPTSGYTTTVFSVDASGSSDAQGDTLQYRFDWENDGTYDTSYSTTATSSHTYSSTGTKTIKVQVTDGSLTSTATVSVSVIEQTSQTLTIHYENKNAWTTPMMHWGYAYYLNVADLAKAGTDTFGVYYTINWTSSESYLTCCFNNGSSTWDGTDRRVNIPTTFPAEVWIKTSSSTVYTSNPNDTTPPTVSLTAPAAGATCTGNVTVSATASDNNTVASVEFYCDTNLIGTDTSSPYSITWNSAYIANGAHSITAKAIDGVGNTTISAARSVTTSNPNIAPVANAGSDATALVNSAVTLNGSGSYDPNGSIASYRWTYGSTTKTGVNPSFTFTATGNYTITLTVTDNEGATSTDTVVVTVVNQLARTDFRQESIYFVITTRFYDGDTGNNFADPYSPNPSTDPEWRGDFKGLIEKLDYIKALGFTAVWITPVIQNKSGYDYHGYHGYDFYNVDPRYCSSDVSFQTLIDAAHARGMKIVLDIVLNHSCNWGAKGLFEPVNDDSLTPNAQFVDRVQNQMFPSPYYHDYWLSSWDSYDDQSKTIAGDCVDFDTENYVVRDYLIGAYDKFIDMGVDAFRIDTAKHISRYIFNSYFIPAFKARGGANFYMFGEVCSRVREIWNRGIPALSPPFFTWKESVDYSGLSDTAAAYQAYLDNATTANQPTSDNHYLYGNTYHTPDYSRRSGFDVIDFTMHWNFENAGSAFGVRGNDCYYNDATWNVVYVDSHDYGPDANTRYNGGEAAWAENLSLMFTFRGIPCIYYGTEVQFKAGAPCDVGMTSPLEGTGRAYFGDNITGSVTVSDFGVWSGATGNMAATLNSPLAKHLSRLNRIRRAIPALQMGQYSTSDVSGGIAFKRRYTSSTVDSFCLVTISGSATFYNIPNGTYVDAVTGTTITVGNNTLTADCSGQGNMRVYVLTTSLTSAPGKIGSATAYLY